LSDDSSHRIRLCGDAERFTRWSWFVQYLAGKAVA
jgi:hypothetical protein